MACWLTVLAAYWALGRRSRIEVSFPQISNVTILPSCSFIYQFHFLQSNLFLFCPFLSLILRFHFPEPSSFFQVSSQFSLFLWKEILEILSWQTEICFSFCKIPFPKIQCIGRTIYLALLWDVSNAIFFWIFLMQCSSRWSPISIHPSLPPNSPVTRSLISLDLDIIIITLTITIITTITITTILRSTALCVPQEEEAGRGESEAQPLIQDHGHISNQVIIIAMVRIV